MLVIPAIDLKDGRCVRLRQGDLAEETVYSDDPAAMALKWQGLGASLIHVVDLNGAVDGAPRNLPAIRAIVKAATVPIQVGGGIRTLDTIRAYLGDGVGRVVLGTAALQDRTLVERACVEFPGRVLLGVDARDGKVAVRGWISLSDRSAIELLQELAGCGLGGVIYTDIARDGMLQGPNVAALQEVAAHSPWPVIASGGISRVEDIRAVKALGPRVAGAIVGKALYDGKLDFRDAVAAAA